MRIFSGMAHRAGKAGASVLFVFKQYACTRITQKQPESLGFQGVLGYSVRIKYTDRRERAEDRQLLRRKENAHWIGFRSITPFESR